MTEVKNDYIYCEELGRVQFFTFLADIVEVLF